MIGDLEQLANETDLLVLSQGIDDHAHKCVEAGLAVTPASWHAWVCYSCLPCCMPLAAVCPADCSPLLWQSQQSGAF